MTAADVHDASAAKETPDSPRGFPGLEQLLSRQTAGVADGTRQSMKERIVGKTAEIVRGQASS